MTAFRRLALLLPCLASAALSAQTPAEGAPFGPTQRISALAGSLHADLQDGERFGAAVAPAGDLDGDGIMDLVVGAPGRDGGTGAVYLLWINNDGWVHRWQRLAEGEGLSGLDPGGGFGAAVTAVGDLDGNGHGDLAVGAPRANAAKGAVWILYRNADGLRGTERFPAWAVPGLPAVPDTRFGAALSPWTRADGRTGLAIGAPGANRVAFASWRPNGRLATPALLEGPPGTAGSAFGSAVDGRGDGDGDGLPDLAVGAPGAAADSGRVWILPGGRVPSAGAWRAGAPGPGASAEGLGASVAWTLDHDGDGGRELVAGTRRADAAQAGYRFGRVGPDGGMYWSERFAAAHPRIALADSAASGFGGALADLGDLNSDHYPEWVFGLPELDDGGPERGGLLILRGFRPGIDYDHDYHEACVNGRRVDRYAIPIPDAGGALVRVPDPASADSVVLELFYRRVPEFGLAYLSRTDGTDTGFQFRALPPRPADPDTLWTVGRMTLRDADSFVVRQAHKASALVLYVFRAGGGFTPEGTKGTWQRYPVARGARERRFLTTVLFSSPRDIFLQAAVTGLAPGRRALIRGAARERVEEREVIGNGDSVQWVDFLFPGLPGGVHGVSLEAISPDSAGGRFLFGWAAGYGCGVLCRAPEQLFFQATGPDAGHLFWQRIPTGARTYDWCLAPLDDTLAERCGTVTRFNVTYPGVDVDSLLPGTAYRFRVRNDCDDGGWADWSAWRTFYTPGRRPKATPAPSPWRLGPNPAAEAVWLHGPEGPLRWTWVGPDGRIRAGGREPMPAGGLRLPLPPGPDGVWLLRLEGAAPGTLRVLRLR